MYSQDAISSHRRSRPEPTEEMLAGLACIVCNTDYRTAQDTDTTVVSHRDGEQLLACHGVCARLISGSVSGLDETPLPLAERIRRHRAGPT